MGRILGQKMLQKCMSFQVGTILFVLSVNCGLAAMSVVLRLLTNSLLGRGSLTLLSQTSVVLMGESLSISRPIFHFLFIQNGLNDL